MKRILTIAAIIGAMTLAGFGCNKINEQTDAGNLSKSILYYLPAEGSQNITGHCLSENTLTKTVTSSVRYSGPLPSIDQIRFALRTAAEQAGFSKEFFINDDFIKIINDTAYIRPFDNSGGNAIYYCALYPFMKKNLLQYEGIKTVLFTEYDDVPCASSSYESTGSWHKVHENILGDEKYQIYSGTETLKVWLKRRFLYNDDKPDTVQTPTAYALQVSADDLKKIPLDIHCNYGTAAVPISISDYSLNDSLKNELLSSSAANPVSLDVNELRLVLRAPSAGGGDSIDGFEIAELKLATELTAIEEDPWKLVHGIPKDYCSDPTYIGSVNLRGWLSDFDCAGSEMPCDDKYFRVADADVSKLPFQDLYKRGDPYYGAVFGLDDETVKKLKDASPNNPKTIVADMIHAYCEGQAPQVHIESVL